VFCGNLFRPSPRLFTSLATWRLTLIRNSDLHTYLSKGLIEVSAKPKSWYGVQKSWINNAMAINSHTSESFNYEVYFGLCLCSLIIQNKRNLKLGPSMQGTASCCFVVSPTASYSRGHRFKSQSHYPKWILWFSTPAVGKCYDITLNYVKTTSFAVLYPLIILPLYVN
jgi:hypothetical protein